MDVRLTTEQRELRDAAARLADDLGPGSVLDLADDDRAARLEKAIAATGWRTLRSDGASGVEVALVVEEFARGLIDVPFVGPVLADELYTRLTEAGGPTEGSTDGVSADGVAAAASGGATVAVDGVAIDAKGLRGLLGLDGTRVLAGTVGATVEGVDLTRLTGEPAGPLTAVGTLDEETALRFRALALVVTTADMLGAARGALTLGAEYAKVRQQYGHAIGSYQAIAHLLAEARALVEGAVSVLRHAAWAVDELAAAEAVQAALVAKAYTERAARTICETSIQVHGGIGNTWECLAHVFLRRVLTSAELFPATLEEIDLGLS
ncbi:acyl-CoA dehydrogenase [Frankia sp. CNm7]|uniref:Acyl-CoA dehydrogenase n=1 Tax=Frankia nepalensis TaxID=1836974 RepID=A0A937RTB1_9ACTN|nr:acyl-CoA dehydrogenase family protein [Frankia nepalensis]MBL7501258.1 acyl-CoA dehydrogenase [Frankia nepalensis]MBL7509456.1 acyl-CoA dehydrogenase [Frankia nepalensis]MBL7519031.1 acyl-CoA dehydrogenase [Frankia nepalensis]MBL7631541.1 acyl-CoA dehydrogenase [Frankia nepalensis]